MRVSLIVYIYTHTPTKVRVSLLCAAMQNKLTWTIQEYCMLTLTWTIQEYCLLTLKLTWTIQEYCMLTLKLTWTIQEYCMLTLHLRLLREEAHWHEPLTRRCILDIGMNPSPGGAYLKGSSPTLHLTTPLEEENATNSPPRPCGR